MKAEEKLPEGGTWPWGWLRLLGTFPKHVNGVVLAEPNSTGEEKTAIPQSRSSANCFGAEARLLAGTSAYSGGERAGDQQSRLPPLEKALLEHADRSHETHENTGERPTEVDVA